MADKLDSIAAAREALDDYGATDRPAPRRAGRGSPERPDRRRGGDRLSMDELTSMAKRGARRRYRRPRPARDRAGPCSPLIPISGACSPMSPASPRRRSRSACATAEPCGAPDSSHRPTSSTATSCSRKMRSSSSLFGGVTISVWDDAARFDIRRDRPVQLTFGSGVHFCMGAFPARARAAGAAPLARLPTWPSTARSTWKPPTVAIWGPSRLPMTFTPTT